MSIYIKLQGLCVCIVLCVTGTYKAHRWLIGVHRWTSLESVDIGGLIEDHLSRKPLTPEPLKPKPLKPKPLTPKT